MHGLNRVENENDIMHYQTSLQRKKEGIPGSNSNNRKGILNCLWSDPGKLINGYVNSFLIKLNIFFQHKIFHHGDVQVSLK